MLPTINTNPTSNDEDVKKQVSTLRTQMSQLRDAIEADLSNIRYDNLSAELRKKLDSLEDTLSGASNTINVVAQNMAVNYATIKELNAASASIQSLFSDYAKVSDLEAATARIGTIEANYATVTSLNSVSARIGNIESSYITADRAYADFLETNDLSGEVAKLGYATVNQLNAVNGQFSNLNAGNITAGTLNCDRLNIDDLATNRFKTRGVNCNVIVADQATIGGKRAYWHNGILCTDDD